MNDSLNPMEERADGLLDDWMSRADLAGELGISVDTLGRWETRRIGPPCIRLGRRVFYRKDDVKDWLREQEPTRGRGGR